MAREPLQIQIADDDGVSHHYEFTPHPAGISVGLVNKLQTILLAPMTAIIAGSKQTKQGGSLFDRELDSASAATAANVLAKALFEAGEERFVKQLLAYAHTRREGEKHLTKCADNFDLLYTQNLGELALAVYHAVQCSFGKSLRRFFKGKPIFQDLLSAISGADNSNPQTTEPQKND